MLASGEVGVALAHSALRVLVGGGTGAALGLVVGLLVGRGGFGRVLGSPLALVRPIPPIAWIPLTLLWFGVGELQQWAILAGATFHVVTAGVRDALDRVPASLVESAKNLGSRGFGLELVRLRAAAPVPPPTNTRSAEWASATPTSPLANIAASSSPIRLGKGMRIAHRPVKQTRPRTSQRPSRTASSLNRHALRGVGRSPPPRRPG